MKRTTAICFFLVTCYLLLVTPCSGQDFDFNRSLEDYLYNYNLYRSQYVEYTSAKSEYLTYQTLTAQTKALETTKTMMISRDEALRTYLMALRMKLRETTGILNYQQNNYYVKLDNEMSWLSEHQTQIPSTSTIKDLLTISSDLEKKYPTTEIMAYQTLGQISSGEENALRSKILEEINRTETKINEIKASGEDTTTLERWLIQAKEKVDRSEEKDKTALGILAALRTNDTNKRDSWNKASTAFVEENQYLKEAVANLKEIIREVKSE